VVTQAPPPAAPATNAAAGQAVPGNNPDQGEVPGIVTPGNEPVVVPGAGSSVNLPSEAVSGPGVGPTPVDVTRAAGLAVAGNIVGGSVTQQVTTSMRQMDGMGRGGMTLAGADISGQSILLVNAEVNVGEIDAVQCYTVPTTGELVCGSGQGQGTASDSTD